MCKPTQMDILYMYNRVLYVYIYVPLQVAIAQNVLLAHNC